MHFTHPPTGAQGADFTSGQIITDQLLMFFNPGPAMSPLFQPSGLIEVKEAPVFFSHNKKLADAARANSPELILLRM